MKTFWEKKSLFSQILKYPICGLFLQLHFYLVSSPYPVKYSNLLHHEIIVHTYLAQLVWNFMIWQVIMLGNMLYEK